MDQTHLSLATDCVSRHGCSTTVGDPIPAAAAECLEGAVRAGLRVVGNRSSNGKVGILACRTPINGGLCSTLTSLACDPYWAGPSAVSLSSHDGPAASEASFEQSLVRRSRLLVTTVSGFTVGREGLRPQV